MKQTLTFISKGWRFLDSRCPSSNYPKWGRWDAENLGTSTSQTPELWRRERGSLLPQAASFLEVSSPAEVAPQPHPKCPHCWETNLLSPCGCLTPQSTTILGYPAPACSPSVTRSSLLPGSAFQLHSSAGRMCSTH